MKNVNSFQIVFYAANAASSLDSCFDAGFRVDHVVCVDDSVFDDDNSVDDWFNNDSVYDDSVDRVKQF
jgi:hypothetical protein